MTKCAACGAESSGNYCAQCGTRLGAEGGCPACGAELDENALFCSACGEPVRERPRKPVSAYLPWILSAVVLVVFSVGIAMLVRDQAAPRIGDMPPTGGVIEGGGGAGRPQMPEQGAGGAGGAASAGGMPSAAELAAMPPREAGDRLFNRAMSLAETGDGGGRAPFFAQMGIQAYRSVPADRVDADLRFHVGLLEIVRGEPGAAAAVADTLLRERPGHLLGLLLAARAAEASGDASAAAAWRDSLRRAATGVDLGAVPEYDAHRALLEEAGRP